MTLFGTCQKKRLQARDFESKAHIEVRPGPEATLVNLHEVHNPKKSLPEEIRAVRFESGLSIKFTRGSDGQCYVHLEGQFYPELGHYDQAALGDLLSTFVAADVRKHNQWTLAADYVGSAGQVGQYQFNFNRLQLWDDSRFHPVHFYRHILEAFERYLYCLQSRVENDRPAYDQVSKLIGPSIRLAREVYQGIPDPVYADLLAGLETLQAMPAYTNKPFNAGGIGVTKLPAGDFTKLEFTLPNLIETVKQMRDNAGLSRLGVAVTEAQMQAFVEKIQSFEGSAFYADGAGKATADSLNSLMGWHLHLETPSLSLA